MEQAFINTVLPKLGLHHIVKMQNPPLWISYDREGDVVHVIFEEAKKSDKALSQVKSIPPSAVVMDFTG